MNDDFKNAFKRFKFLKVQDLLALFGICSFKSFKQGEFLAEEGKTCKYAFLIRKGIVRTYVLTPGGDQRTIKLAKEGEFTTSGMSFLEGRPSTEYLEALEDCKVIAIEIEKVNKLAETNIRFLRLSNDAMKEAFLEAINRIEFFTIYSPEQRYKKLLEDSPELLQRVPQKFLASYLGVTTVSLSRIRNRNLFS